MITVIGLGNKEGDLTQAQIKAIEQTNRVVVKTANAPTFTYFNLNKIKVDTLDFIYEQATDYTDLDTQIVDYLLSLPEKHIIYCVNGAGYTDSSVIALAKKTKVDILAGVSAEARILAHSPHSIYNVYSAAELPSRARNMIDTNLPLIVYEVFDSLTAQEVKIALLEIYSEESKVIFFHNNKVEVMPLFEIDRQPNYNYTTTIGLSPTEFTVKDIFTFGDVVDIVEKLRKPGGCPWDRGQTLASIRGNIIEEAYELVEAIDLDNVDKIVEECGDVLLQAVFSAVIGKDKGDFDINNVTTMLAKKLIFRHSHIFGTDKAENQEEALLFWEQAKKKEKSQKTINDAISGVAQTFNALLRAEKIQKIIKKTGFDFECIEDARQKVYEELQELKEAKTEQEIEHECGDLLFSAVNLLRMLGVNPEVALNYTTNKFIKRFEYVIKRAEQEGCDIYDCPVEKMHQWYYQGKIEENL